MFKPINTKFVTVFQLDYRVVRYFKVLFSFLFVLVSLLTSAQNSVDFLFIGHCYQFGTGGNRVDYRVEALELDVYNGIWLGGDVCSEAMLNYPTVEYIDNLFDLGNPETHWSLGNHDARNGNWEWYEEFTNRRTFYTYSNFGITRVVMNTNIVPTDCESLNAQYEMIIAACDTVNTENELILIMHHGIWRDVPGLPIPGGYAQSDLRYWNSNCYSVHSTFVESIYPKLVEAKQRGVEVYCILGDMGAGPKSIDFLSDDGIRFLGCGLYHNEPEDVVLVLTKELETGQLSFQYHNLDSLLLVQP